MFVGCLFPVPIRRKEIIISNVYLGVLAIRICHFFVWLSLSFAGKFATRLLVSLGLGPQELLFNGALPSFRNKHIVGNEITFVGRFDEYYFLEIYILSLTEIGVDLTSKCGVHSALNFLSMFSSF